MDTFKVQSAILIQYTFCQIQQIAPHGPLAVHSEFVTEEIRAFIHRLSSANGKRTVLPRPSHKHSKPINTRA